MKITASESIAQDPKANYVDSDAVIFVDDTTSPDESGSEWGYDAEERNIGSGGTMKGSGHSHRSCRIAAAATHARDRGTNLKLQ